MIKALHYKLKMIRYYSAPRRRTILTKMVDVSLITAIILAVPATFLADVSLIREQTIISRSGHLSRVGDDGVSATILDPDVSAWSRTDIPYGEFHLTLVKRDQGWPIRSSSVQPRIELELNLYDQPGSKKGVVLADDDPLQEVILKALQAGLKKEMAAKHKDFTLADDLEANYTALIDCWQRRAAQRDVRLGGWISNMILWWLILSGSLSVMASGLWVVFMIFSHNNTIAASRRKSDGCCVQCGYNLYGLEFNARCPECGSEIY